MCHVQGAPTTQDFVSIAQTLPNITVDTSMIVQRVEVSPQQQIAVHEAYLLACAVLLTRSADAGCCTGPRCCMTRVWGTRYTSTMSCVMWASLRAWCLRLHHHAAPSTENASSQQVTNGQHFA